MFAGTIELVEKNSTIRRIIAIHLAKDVNQVLGQNKAKLSEQIEEVLSRELKGSFEYQSLTAARGSSPPGGLRAEFGLSSPTLKLAAIIDRWLNSVRVVVVPVRPVSDGLKGGLLITAINADFQDVISLEEATQISKGGNIPWLEWMLTRAGQEVVDGFDILFRPNIKNSRSGNAIMVEHSTNYAVPDKPFAGTITDNWITRIVEKIRPEIEILIVKVFD